MSAPAAARRIAVAALLLGACGDDGSAVTAGAEDVSRDVRADAHNDTDVGNDAPPVDASEDASPPDVEDDPLFDIGPGELALRVLRPEAGQTANARFGIEAIVGGAEGATVEFFGGDVLIRSDETPPYAAVWDVSAVAEGEYTIRAIARAGEREAEGDVVVYVDHSGPSIRFVEPGTTLVGPRDGVLAVELEVTDRSGVDEVSIAFAGFTDVPIPVAGPPYLIEVPVPDDTPQAYRLEARATDIFGHATLVSTSVRACGAGASACGDFCFEDAVFDDNPYHCGGCNSPCELGLETCSGGACACLPGLSACGAECANLVADPRHCGACGAACAADERCSLGECVGLDGRGMVAIPPGTFRQGSADDELGRDVTTEFRLEVTLTRAFELGVTEVTHAEWERFFEVNPSEFWACGPDCPVDSVNWYEALRYANALSESEGLAPCYVLEECNGRVPGNGQVCESVEVTSPSGNPLDCVGYRLPTEAEWEYAYRAGTTSATYAGPLRAVGCEVNEHIDAIAWYDCTSGGTPHPVATRLPNAFGLHDMAGNVFEWAGDSWRSEVEISRETDPLGGDPETLERTFKGGAWNERADRLRAGARLSSLPGRSEPFVGFRVARTLSSSEGP